MSIYSLSGDILLYAYNVNGLQSLKAYDVSGSEVYSEGIVVGQQYLGGYIEIQPDSWDGTTPVTNTIVDNTSPTAWGFPYSLSSVSKKRIHDDILNGENGIRFIRFPLGFAYRGARNIDSSSGLAKNFGERWSGQNEALSSWLSDIAKSGGGIAPEYWCIPPYWITKGDIGSRGNLLWAGGTYDRSVTLHSIKNSDRSQYDSQIDALTDAIIDDYTYLNQNVAPVVMYGLSNEPVDNGNIYGSCKWDDETYSDVLSVLSEKMKTVFPNAKLHCSSDYSHNPWSIGQTFIRNHASDIWGYSYHKMRYISGENALDGAYGADAFYKSSYFKEVIKNGKKNVFNNEYEYFSIDSVPDNLRCANNMVHLINELVYGESEVLHPIIHICKPNGQTHSATNTSGYCLFVCDMNDGSVEENTWAYNSWKMFNDNLPFGAMVIKNYIINSEDIGFVSLIKNDKIYVFVANRSGESKTIKANFFTNRIFQWKLYNLTNVGTIINDADMIETITIPAYSGICCIEN